MATRALIGISGWRYAPWRGVFYPEGLPARDELKYAAERLATIELNGSFYSLQRPEYYTRWSEQVPPGFVFAVKGSRYITHMLRLRGIEKALANFFASGVLALHGKLGPLLWQLPPTLPFDERLEPFLSASRDALICALPKIACCAMRSKCATRASRRASSSSCCASTMLRSSSPTRRAAGRSLRT
jgi:uncharacterized protein YecE (DUF72 family)